jgi:hypothetical protein
MKKLLLSLVLILTSVLTFGQTDVDIWKKSKIGKIFSQRKFTFPKTFTSKSPSGKQIVYQRVEHPEIKIETSSGRKWTRKPIIYKSNEDFGVITYDGKDWSGLHTEDGYNVSNLTKDKVTNIKMDAEKFSFGEGDVLKAPLRTNKKMGRSLQNNPDFYNPYIRINKTCGVYVEVANDLYKFWGSDTARVAQYVTTILTNVIALYDREGINVTLNKIFVWDTPDPYGNPFDNSQYLEQFTENINKNIPTYPDAHFKHLLHNKNLGGIAWINGESDGYITDPNLDPYYTCAVTGIGSNIVVNSSITYSWPVMCFTHEMGHNLGAKHTHWCGWKNEINQSIGRIDSCFRGESSDGPDNCTINTYSVLKSNTKGSIMSYCHLNGAISFTTGFGKLPRYSIRSNLNDASEIPFNGGGSPTVTTDTASSRTATSAVCGGNVTSDGGFPVQDRGLVWSTMPNPTLDLTSKLSIGTGNGLFSSQITGLLANTTYYIRAYAKNSAGVSYGNQITFSTLFSSEPSLTTNPITAITNNSAITGGTYITIGNTSILERGAVISTTNPVPTINDTKVLTTPLNNSNYTTSLTGLLPNTTYYVRAFARNVVGTAYGNVLQFTTLGDGQISITMVPFASTSISFSQVTALGTINSNGGQAITERGFYISSLPEAQVTGSKRISTGTALGNYSLVITNLTPNSLYYIKAYAINSFDTSFSNEITVTTNRAPLVLDEVSSIESTKATFKYTIGPTTLIFSSSSILVSTNSSPTRANSQFTFQSTYVGQGQGTIIGQDLLPNTTYYVRGVLPTTTGDVFSSNILQFQTTTISGLPTVNNLGSPSKTKNTITIRSEVVSQGSSLVFNRGVCYSTAPNPTISNSILVSGQGVGQYTVTLTNLTPGALYYIRSYATNKSGTSYSNEINVYTSGEVPTVITSPITNISLTTANGGGNVTVSGGAIVTSKGVIWSTSPNPTVSLITKTVDGSGTGIYTSAITGLVQNTKYYVRSYAISDNGVGYGDELSFTTLPSPSTASVITSIVTNILPTSATSGGNVTYDGGSTVSAKGICWSTNQNPTVDLPTKTFDGSGLGPYVSQITNLTLGVTYYVRAYATNSTGTNYGAQYSFTTSFGTPIVVTTPINGITITSASTGGNVTSQGNAPVTQRGICYSTTPNPTIENSVVLSGIGVGSYTSNILGLIASTTYYVRAFATNSLGTSYGSQLTFTTFPESGGSCQISGLNASLNQDNKWTFSYNINPKCATYSVNVCRYNYTDSNNQPPTNASPISCGVRNNMNSYIPTSQELNLGLIQREMNPQPTASIRSGFGGFWYSIDVRCAGQNCIGSNITKYFFYVPGL